ncbi:Endoplasmic reticulum-Golgi intermediate compartment protein 3 [Trichostrongylus colubriformis]|uniref:Endoplasmic reticulum-Golgi intermediate compartment protein 3 n=1 Tax=Trichostrongylus colubriformis TaxID=6319 RepID=A0AAN8FXC4_TRICO
MAFFTRLRELDAYTKPMEDFRVKTLSGGMVSLISSIVIVLLAIQETHHYLAGDIVEQLFVDTTSSDIRLDVHFDISFPYLPCGFITVDVMDVTGENQDNIQDDVFKIRLDRSGKNISTQVQKIEINQNKTVDSSKTTTVKCGSCYGALPEGSCCNTCAELKEAYQLRGWQVNVDEVEQCKSDPWFKMLEEFKDEGCRIYGKLQVAKVAGNFHFAPGDPHRIMRSHIHDFHDIDLKNFDTAHRINHLSFGNDFPGKKHPLNGMDTTGDRGAIMHNYYVKVVPTSYVHMDGRIDSSHQFSVTTHQKDISKGDSEYC